jgi:hypothetical protein
MLYRVVPWEGGWMAVGDTGVILRSTDGTQWSRQTVQPPWFLMEVAYGADTFVAAGEGGRVHQAKTK